MTRQYVKDRRRLEERLGIERDRNIQLGNVSSGFSAASDALNVFGLYVAFAGAVGVTVMTAPVALTVGVVGFFAITVNSKLIGEAKSRSDARLRSLSQDLARRNRLLRKIHQVSKIKDRRLQDAEWQALYASEPEVVAMVATAAVGAEIDRITSPPRRRGSGGGGSGFDYGYGGHYPSYGVNNGSYAIGIGNDYIDPPVRRPGGGGGIFDDDHLMALA